MPLEQQSLWISVGVSVAILTAANFFGFLAVINVILLHSFISLSTCQRLYQTCLFCSTPCWSTGDNTSWKCRLQLRLSWELCWHESFIQNWQAVTVKSHAGCHNTAVIFFSFFNAVCHLQHKLGSCLIHEHFWSLFLVLLCAAWFRDSVFV